MALLFLWCLSSVVLLATSQKENICLWGRAQLNDRPTNGLYRRGPEQVNGKFYWKLDRSDQGCAGKYYYLFWYDDTPHGWYIGFGGDTFGFGIQSPLIGRCRSTTSVLNSPVDCGPNWSFGVGNTGDAFPIENIDSAVTASWDRCPALDCSSIAISYNGINACDGTAQQTGPNRYTAGDNSFVWYFNQPFFQWTCTQPYAAKDTCVGQTTDTGLLNYGPVKTWQDASNGQVITYDDSKGSTGTFTCSGVGKTDYTYSPTTAYPTQPKIPTPYPTFKPLSPADFPTAPTVPTVQAPTVPTVQPVPTPPPAPTKSSDGDDDDDNNNGGGGGNGGDDDDDDDMWSKSSVVDGMPDILLWIIIIVLVLCCCCVICFLIYKKKKQRTEQYFG